MITQSTLDVRLAVSDIFRPKENEITLQTQQMFAFGNICVTHVLRDFYEGLARAIFAGKVRNRQNEQEDEIEPDLTDEQRKRYIEVKSAGHTRRVMLKDGQIKKYVNLQLSEALILNPRIYFTFFRYGVRGINERVRGMSSDGVIQYLCLNTRFMVGLPLSVAHTIHQRGLKGDNFYTRCNTQNCTPCTNFPTLAFDRFFLDPEIEIHKLDLDPADYTIRRTRVEEGVAFNHYPLSPFPMTLVKETQSFHAEWVAQLRKELIGWVPF